MDLVTVITPSHNSQATIAESILSILSQTYSMWELIIIDDASTDDTVRIVEEFAEGDPRIKLIRLDANSGAATARNMGIEAAQGKYIAFLDSDDVWLTNKLLKQVEFMKANDYDFTFTAYQRFNSRGEKLAIVRAPLTVNYKALLYSNHIGCLTAMYNAHKLGKQYMPLIRKRQDLGLWLRILKQTEKAYFLDEVLGLYRVGGESLSSGKTNAAKYQWQLYRRVLNYGRIRSSWYFVCYAFNGFFKHLR